MNAQDLKNKFVAFFVDKNHKEIPSSRLVPENDPTTLFVSAGIQPLVPYFLGKEHPSGSRLVNVQKCVRTGDIEEVGDPIHHTFFEMLGNWSLGDYFKDEMIPWSFVFLTKDLNISINNLAVSCFLGDSDAPKDEETAKLWTEQGVPPSRIAFLPKSNNWWGPPGVTGPCGTDTEMFYWTGSDPAPDIFNPEDSRWVEIWNDVLIQYFKNDQGKYEKLIQNNIDTGMGVERTIAILNGFADNYQTDIWQPIIKKIEELTKLQYGDKTDDFYMKDNKQCWVDVRKSMRIIADHIRSAVFIMADGVEPSNKESGYVLRRLIRRAIRQGKLLGIENNFIVEIAKSVFDNQNNFAGIYPELDLNKDKILQDLEIEETKFRKTLNNGLRELNKIIDQKKQISSQQAFTLYESFGFPVEMINEELSKYNQQININDFQKLKQAHQDKSRTLSAGKFKSGLADNSNVITQYHTATHMLHAALRLVLGDHVQQSGSNITSERLRFDFTHPEKLNEQQLLHISDIVNQKINESLPVTCQIMLFSEAQKIGSLAFFGTKYPEKVSVYTVGDYTNYFSREVCTGPHVKNTSELGIFEIIKEESSGSGKRRIYAVLKI
ncbi:MAG: alanine--tRNA ligase [Candidatus Shapirobacteria bacterium]|jgi:alanyl-tRNA synthetase